LAKSVSLSGALGGAAVGAVIYVGGGAGAWGLLLATFIAASVTSRLGIARKTSLGIAEERGGRRGAGNAIANCGVAAAAAVVALTTPYTAPALLALVAALTAGGSDTVASEIGKAWGRSTFLVTTLSRVPAGTPGAMSLEGTAAGVLAALALAAVGVAFGLVPASAIFAIVAGATIGALVESALGATLEGPGILNNDMLNFMTTAVAAAAAFSTGRGGLRAYVDLARPFTLVAPALGFISGALTAIGAAPREPWSIGLLTAPLIGSVMAALLNAGNNALNQI